MSTHMILAITVGLVIGGWFQVMGWRRALDSHAFWVKFRTDPYYRVPPYDDMQQYTDLMRDGYERRQKECRRWFGPLILFCLAMGVGMVRAVMDGSVWVAGLYGFNLAYFVILALRWYQLMIGPDRLPNPHTEHPTFR